MIRSIVAISSNGVIGVEGQLPFYYPEDLKHFKECTLNSTVIMGRKTLESIGRALPKRKNIVISKDKNLHLKYENIYVCQSLLEAVETHQSNNIWLIGGRSIYEMGMEHVAEIHVTVTPDIVISDKELVKFPWINPLKFEISSKEKFQDNEKLYKIIYRKIKF